MGNIPSNNNNNNNNNTLYSHLGKHSTPTDLSKINSSGVIASSQSLSTRSSLSDTGNESLNYHSESLSSSHYYYYGFNSSPMYQIDDGHEDYDLMVDIDELSPQHLMQKGFSIKLSKELEYRILDRIKQSWSEAVALAHEEENQKLMQSIHSHMNHSQQANSTTTTTTTPQSFINTQAIVPGVLPTQITNAPSRPPSPSAAFGGLPSTNNTSTDHSNDNTSSAGDLTPRDSIEDPFACETQSSHQRKFSKKRNHHHYINYFAEIEHKFTQQPSCVVSVLGFKNCGKTHVLNELSGSDLRVGLTQSTPALCFKVPRNNQGRDWLLVDTMGLHSPIRISEIKRQLKEIQKDNMLPQEDIVVTTSVLNQHAQEQFQIPANNSQMNFTAMNNGNMVHVKNHGMSRPLSTSTAVPAINMSSMVQQQQQQQQFHRHQWVDPEEKIQRQWNEAIDRTVREKKMMEDVIQELLLNMSHFILFVVNEMSWEEYKLLYELIYRRDHGINPTTGKPRKITFVVVHNFKECDQMDDFNKMVQKYVVEAFPGELRSKEVNIVGSTLSGSNNSSSGNNVTNVGFAPFYTSGSGNCVVNHVFLAKKESEIGQKYNPLTYALIRIWLASQSTERIHCMTSYLTSHIQAALQKHIDNIKDVQMTFKVKKGLFDDNSLMSTTTHMNTNVNNNTSNSINSNSSSGGGGGLLSSWASSMIRGSNSASHTNSSDSSNKKNPTSQMAHIVPSSIGEFILKFLPEDECQLQYCSASNNSNSSTAANVVGMYTGGVPKKSEEEESTSTESHQ
ncbi:hypothetical protein C9374_003490 [Naegleria lovaniensis]|uniref:G domain-containing protein n=1 Tax=Naegleria lovaniensis TaxID=51637 RepID=A0AA88KJI8_NAELO|nr:uncharacterized protein C9374_003490 [Naegleria lovaniensis]KAG2385675.1 hypothetical protein C9374_003490 [Naegleria lovaniensis]